MTRLVDLFDDLAGDRPVSRITATQAYAAGRRRRRNRRILSGTGVLAAVTAGVIVVAATFTGAPRTDVTTDSTSGPPLRPGFVYWVATTHDDLLYATIGDCPPGKTPGDGCRGERRLIGSEDGGRTWTERTDSDVQIMAYGSRPGELVAYGRPEVPFAANYVQPSAAAGPRRMVVSTDGGRTWRDVTFTAGERVDAVPAGDVVIPGDDGMYALNAPAARARILAHQPPDGVGGYDVTSSRGDALVFAGSREDFGITAVVSTDGGRTWGQHTFTDMECGLLLCPKPEIVAGPDRTVYMVAERVVERPPGRPPVMENRVYRSTDGGRVWVRVDAQRSLPHNTEGTPIDSRITVTPDGTLLVGVAEPAGLRYFRAVDGGQRFEPAQFTGLPAGAVIISPNLGGGLAAIAGQQVYHSTDGRSWRRVTMP